MVKIKNTPQENRIFKTRSSRVLPKYLIILLAWLVFAFGLELVAHAASVTTANPFEQSMSDRVVLHGNVHPLARPEFEVGRADPSMPMDRIILALRPTPGKQAELEKLLVEQQDMSSPNFHRWLTPEEFGAQFGPTDEDINTITQWLSSQGFVVDEIAKGRTWINFSGTAANVETVFQTEIHQYFVNGELHHSNSTEPSIPRSLSSIVAGPVSLNDFKRKSMNASRKMFQAGYLQPNDTYGGSHYMSPGDFAIIYNVNSLYSAAVDGTGQTIAIVARTHPSSTNWSTFRSLMGLSANPPVVKLNGPDPGDLGANEDGETDLDTEWSGAVAKNATIDVVISKSTSSSDGADLSAQYIVNNNLAPVMSSSFGLCESQMGTGNSFYNNLWAQAATQGISVFVSTGDSGAAGCDSPDQASATLGLAVSGLASTPYNTAVGGTQFNEGSGSYWNASDNAWYTSALSYIPEVAWNESGNVTGGTGLWASSGGISSIYAKPAWQVAPGVPVDGRRDIPDVSLSAAGHDGYLVESQGALYIFSGTSAASPSFAGLMALVVQKTGQRQGNANPRLYQLANAQYGSGGVKVFHDITAGNNSVPGLNGYSCGVGYDLATGLGSVDATALVNNWVSLPPVSGVCGTSNGMTFYSTPATNLCNVGTPTAVGGNGSWTWSCLGANGGSTANCTAISVIQTITPSAGAGGTISPNAPQTVNHSLTYSFTVTPNSGYAATVGGTCGGSPAGGITQFTYITGPIIADCTVSVAFTTSPVNGACGLTNGQLFTTIPTVDLCSAGLDTSVSGSSTWTWSCMGLLGGTTSSCSASYQPSLSVMTLSGNIQLRYPSIQAAYEAALDASNILTPASLFSETVNLDRNITVTMEGGYDPGFNFVTGFTSISGSMIISSGTVIIDNLILQ